MNRDLFYDFKLKLFDWLDEALKNGSPDNAVALCFNIYECENCNWRLEIIAANNYDKKNDDWACNEVCDFGTRDKPFVWDEPPRSKFEFVKHKVVLALNEYLKNGKHANIFESKKCVAVGFVDGDLTVIHTKKQEKLYIPKHLILAIITVAVAVGVYLLDIFVFNNSYQENIFRFILLCASIIVFYVKFAISKNNEFSAIEKDYSDEIGFAFKYDKKNKIKLLKAIKYYSKDNYINYLKCVNTLNKLYKKAENSHDNQAIELILAMACEKIDSVDQAIQTYNFILQENPLNLTALRNMAAIYAAKEDYEGAINYATTAVNAWRDPYAYVTLASAYLKTFDLEKAKFNAHTAFKLMPNLVQGVNVLSIAYALENNPKSEEYINLSINLGAEKENLVSAIQFYKDSYEEHQKQMERIALLLNKWRQFTLKQTIAVMLSDEKSKSIIGGNVNEKPPISKSGEEMRLLAAIFCSELPQNTIMPKKGVLRFYITPDEYYGADFDNFNLNKQNNFRVMFDENEENYITTLSNEVDDNFPILRSRYLSFAEVYEGMTLSDYRFEKTFKKLRDDLDIEVLEEDMPIFEEQINGFEHKILGYPSFTQYDPRFEEFKKYDTLLFQLVSQSVDADDEIMFGDSGAMQFFIPSEKLERCDFSDILYTWDCY